MFRFVSLFGIFFLVIYTASIPVEKSTDSTESTTESEISEDVTETVNSTIQANEIPQNLFVIKSVVYEIGILTDGDYNDASNETHEQVDVSFFDPERNGSIIDLSNIPIPIQTNISGVAVTGILPTDLGSINLNEDGTASFNGSGLPIFPSRQVRVTHNISLADINSNSSILFELPKFLGLDGTDKNNESSEENEENKVAEKEPEVKKQPAKEKEIS